MRSYTRLNRPRLIDCDRVTKQTVKPFPVFALFFRASPKKVFYRLPDLVLMIYTPKGKEADDLHPKRKRSPWPNSRGDQGFIFRATNGGKRNCFLGRRACILCESFIKNGFSFCLNIGSYFLIVILSKNQRSKAPESQRSKSPKKFFTTTREP